MYLIAAPNYGVPPRLFARAIPTGRCHGRIDLGVPLGPFRAAGAGTGAVQQVQGSEGRQPGDQVPGLKTCHSSPPLPRGTFQRLQLRHVRTLAQRVTCGVRTRWMNRSTFPHAWVGVFESVRAVITSTSEACGVEMISSARLNLPPVGLWTCLRAATAWRMHGLEDKIRESPPPAPNSLMARSPEK